MFLFFSFPLPFCFCSFLWWNGEGGGRPHHDGVVARGLLRVTPAADGGMVPAGLNQGLGKG